MISIIIPAHNEEENISDVIEKIESSLNLSYELVVVNDHSIDKTTQVLENLSKRYTNMRFVENKLEKGFANAIRTGFLEARGDFVVLVMADLCDDLKSIEQMYDKMISGYDVICASRYVKNGARLGGSGLKAFLSGFAGRSIYYLLGIPTHDIANAFKMYRKKVLDAIKIESKGFEISMELPLKAYFLGFKVSEVPTIWRERTKGKSSFKIFKLLPKYLKLYFWAIKMRIKNAINFSNRSCI